MEDIYVTGDASQQIKIDALRGQTGFCDSPNGALHLYWNETGLALRDSERRFGDIRIDFDAGKTKHRSQFGGSEALPKACGLKGNPGLRVLDCTCGYGQDTWVLARYGAMVTAAERTPALYALLHDALSRSESSISDNITLHLADAGALIAKNNASDDAPWNAPYDVAYLDPMFPARQKSAAVKKEMQALHLLVGHQPFDAGELLALARAAIPRVVVKRPKTAAPLAEATQVYAAGNIRFDIYLGGA